MKKIHLMVLAAGVLGGAVLLGQSFAQEKPAAGAALPVGVCDVVAVFKNYDRAKDLTNKLKARIDEIHAEGDKRGKEIDKIKMTMEELEGI